MDALAPIAAFGQKLPQIADAGATMAQMVYDVALEAGVDPMQAAEQAIPALPKAIPLAVKAIAPETLALLTRLSDRTSDLALALDALDALDQRLAAAGIDKNALSSKGVDVAVRMAATAGTPELTALVQAKPFEREALDLTRKAGEALLDARKSPPTPLGFFGLLKAVGEPDVAKTLALGIQFARNFGKSLG